MVNFNFERSYLDPCVWTVAFRLSSVVFGQPLLALGASPVSFVRSRGLKFKAF